MAKTFVIHTRSRGDILIDGVRAVIGDDALVVFGEGNDIVGQYLNAEVVGWSEDDPDQPQIADAAAGTEE